MLVKRSPDVLVLAPETPTAMLAVEVKSRFIVEEDELPVLASAIRGYLRALGCPVGLLVTPESTWCFSGPGSPVDEAERGAFAKVPTSDLLRASRQAASEQELELQVVGWLERITVSPALVMPTRPDVFQLVRDVIGPLVEGGRIVVGPRRQ
ncbi:MAG: hypothetical protein ACYC8T_34700 [Myxococcaceae bacterium]